MQGNGLTLLNSLVSPPSTDLLIALLVQIRDDITISVVDAAAQGFGRGFVDGKNSRDNDDSLGRDV
jgi:hypothetical protein